MKRLIILCLLPLFFIFSCSNASKTEKIVKVAKTLSNSLVSFSGIVIAIDELTTMITTNTKERLTTELKEDTYENVAKEWEKTWKKIQKKVYDLDDEYDKIREESVTYFQKLRELENETHNEDLREEMNRKTTTKENEFNIALGNASSEIERIKKMVEMGSDFHNMLLQDVLLTQVNYRISELNKIQREANLICQRLNEFSQTGTMLIRK